MKHPKFPFDDIGRVLYMFVFVKDSYFFGVVSFFPEARLIFFWRCDASIYNCTSSNTFTDERGTVSQENNMYGSMFCLGEVIKALRISMLDVSFKTLDSCSIPNTFFVWSFGGCFIICWWNVTVGGQQGGGLKHLSFSHPPGEMIQFDY